MTPRQAAAFVRKHGVVLESAAGLKVPLLAITGDLDPVLSAHRHLPAIQQLTAESESIDISIRELPGHNHVFQKAETGKFEEYLTINETFSYETLQQITSWILDRFSTTRSSASEPPSQACREGQRLLRSSSIKRNREA